MNIDELAARLQAMEQLEADRAAEAEQRGFIDKYGTMFSGDEGIGMAILAEMNRRGVPSAQAGADKVVQEIIDSLRQEATMILDKLKGEQAAVMQLMDQMQDVQESVAAATGEAPAGDGMVDAPIPPPPMDAASAPPPIDAGAPPPDLGAPPPAPVDAGAPPPEAAPIAGEMPPPVDAVAPPPVPSDARIKTVLKVAPKPKAVAAKKAAPAHLLSAIYGGLK